MMTMRSNFSWAIGSSVSKLPPIRSLRPLRLVKIDWFLFAPSFSRVRL
jgi:hypothetical protein